MNPASNAYSIRSWPSSSRTKRFKSAFIVLVPLKANESVSQRTSPRVRCEFFLPGHPPSSSVVPVTQQSDCQPDCSSELSFYLQRLQMVRSECRFEKPVKRKIKSSKSRNLFLNVYICLSIEPEPIYILKSVDPNMTQEETDVNRESRI